MTRRALAARPSKYGAVKTTVDGETFDSKAEARRWCDLVLLMKAGEIRPVAGRDTLRGQSYDLTVNGVKVCRYESDFEYEEARYITFPKFEKFWRRVVEDCKGMKTPVYRLKRKLMKAVHEIEIFESK